MITMTVERSRWRRARPSSARTRSCELLEYTGGAGEEGEEGGGEEGAGVEAEAELLEETSEEDGAFLDPRDSTTPCRTFRCE